MSNNIERVLAKLTEMEGSLQSLEQSVRFAIENLYRQFEAYQSLLALIKPAFPLPPLRGWALSPDALVAISTLVLQAEPRVIVELGSGSSTVVLGYLARMVGRTRVFTVEHDEGFLQRTLQLLALHRLTEPVVAVCAPLRSFGVSPPWYDIDRLASALPQQIDLLVVDGPPVSISPEVRYTAGPALFDRLTAGSIVVLDDAGRPGERAVVERWRSEFGMAVSYAQTEKGLAIMAREQSMVAADQCSGDH
jgi:predicted O-methyltransferase YrrM